MRKKKQANPFIVIPALVVHAVIATVTWRDIARRTDEQIRGPRALWRFASTINTMGSVAYWVFGRK